MSREETGRRSIGGGQLAVGVRKSLSLLGLLAVVGAAGRALAFQSPGGPRSVLGPGSAGEPAKAAAGRRSRRRPDPGEKAKLTPQEARELTQALRQLQAAVQADRQAGSRTVEVQVKRPARTVTPPTLTPAELDRLVARYLTKNDPKVDPAPITTDVEFVRRVYFDLIGKPPTPDAVHGVRARPLARQARPADRRPARTAPTGPGTGPDTGATWSSSTPPTRT